MLRVRLSFLLLTIGLALAARPARADWMLLYGKATGNILMVSMLTADECAAQLRAPGPRPGTARLHYKAEQIPSVWLCRVTPAGDVACDGNIMVGETVSVSSTAKTTAPKTTRGHGYVDNGKDVRVPVGPRRNPEVGYTEPLYDYDHAVITTTPLVAPVVPTVSAVRTLRMIPLKREVPAAALRERLRELDTDGVAQFPSPPPSPMERYRSTAVEAPSEPPPPPLPEPPPQP